MSSGREDGGGVVNVCDMVTDWGKVVWERVKKRGPTWVW